MQYLRKRPYCVISFQNKLCIESFKRVRNEVIFIISWPYCLKTEVSWDFDFTFFESNFWIISKTVYRAVVSASLLMMALIVLSNHPFWFITCMQFCSNSLVFFDFSKLLLLRESSGWIKNGSLTATSADRSFTFIN